MELKNTAALLLGIFWVLLGTAGMIWPKVIMKKIYTELEINGVLRAYKLHNGINQVVFGLGMIAAAFMAKQLVVVFIVPFAIVVLASVGICNHINLNRLIP